LELRVVKTANATGKIKSKNDNSTCMMPLNSFLACTYFYHCSLDKLVLLVSLYSKNSVIFVINFGTLANRDVGAKIYSVSHIWFVQKSRQLFNIELSLSISEKLNPDRIL